MRKPESPSEIPASDRIMVPNTGLEGTSTSNEKTRVTLGTWRNWTLSLCRPSSRSRRERARTVYFIAKRIWNFNCRWSSVVKLYQALQTFKICRCPHQPVGGRWLGRIISENQKWRLVSFDYRHGRLELITQLPDKTLQRRQW